MTVGRSPQPDAANRMKGAAGIWPKQGMPAVSGQAGDPVLAAIAGLIRNTTQCIEAAVFEYGLPTGGTPSIGRHATNPETALSFDFISMVQASPQALLGAPGCFDAGMFSNRAEARYVIGLRFGDGRHAFAGGYAVFRTKPGTNEWSTLHGIGEYGAQLIQASRKGRIQQQASTDARVFQNRMFEGLQCGNDAYWETDSSSVIRNVVIFRGRPEVLRILEGKSISTLLASAQGASASDFRNLHIELDMVGEGRISIAISGCTLPDGTMHGTARLGDANKNTELTRGSARLLVEKLEDAHRAEAALRREAELVLDGLGILTSGQAGREIFKSLLDLLGPALEFQNALVLQRDWSGRVAAAAATADELLSLDWSGAGEHLFGIEDGAVALAVPGDLAIPGAPSHGNTASTLSIKLKGGSKPALLLCLHEQPDYFGTRHLGLGSRLSLVASQAFINEEERQRVVESSKLATIGEMAAGIVHEINQPLTSVTLGIHNLLDALDQEQNIEPARLRTKLERFRGQIERIAKIVASMRVLARRSDGIDEPFSLDAVIRQAAEIAQHKLTTARIALELSISDESATGNPLEFGQVILNLLTNAHDAILEKARRIPEAANDPRIISVATEAIDEEWLEIVVRDTGCGFPSEAIDHAFQAFATTKEPGKGTGLGLTLCRRIVENMKGTIAAGNWSGGAEIRIRLKRSAAKTDLSAVRA